MAIKTIQLLGSSWLYEMFLLLLGWDVEGSIVVNHCHDRFWLRDSTALYHKTFCLI